MEGKTIVKRLAEADKCTACNACSLRCPVNAIHVECDENGFRMPVIDENLCLNCGICHEVCQSRQNFKEKRITAFIGKNKDLLTRRQSTSGGIFTALANNIFSKGGVCFGAAFDEELMVRHVKAENTEELAALRKSKYVESDTKDTYRQVKELLLDGRYVLYSGTPCQIGGLYAYLGKKYDRLFCLDLICQGTPGQGIWKAHLAELGQRGEISNFDFRDGCEGFDKLNISYVCKKDGDVAKNIIPSLSDGYMKGFSDTEILRESCYSCDFRGENGIGDITIGDCWGYEELTGKKPDRTGESVIIINTQKGLKAFDEIKDMLLIEQEIDVDSLRKYNRNLFINPSYTMKREVFLKRLKDNDRPFECFNEDVRSKMYVELLTKWLEAEISGENRIACFLKEKRICNIAIYGMGTFGQMLYKVLNKQGSPICIMKCFDNNPPENVREICTIVSKMCESDFCGVDAVIITPIHLKRNISKLIKTCYNGIIIGLDDILMSGAAD